MAMSGLIVSILTAVETVSASLGGPGNSNILSIGELLCENRERTSNRSRRSRGRRSRRRGCRGARGLRKRVPVL